MACTHCEKLTRMVAELERRVKTLIDIRKTEDLIDSMLPNSPEAKLPANESPLEQALSPSTSGPHKPRPAIGTSMGNWETQDNKRKKRGRNSSRIASPPVPLANRFGPLGILQEEQVSTPKAKRHRSASRAANEHEGPGSPSHRGGYSTPARPHRLRQGVPHFTPSPSRTTRTTIRAPIQPDQTIVQQDSRRLRYANTTSTSAEATHCPSTLRGANAANTREANTASIVTEADLGPERGVITANPNNPRTGRITTDKAIVGNANTSPQMATILIGDAMTAHVKLAKTENLCLRNTSVEVLSSKIQTILKNKTNNPKIIIHAGSFDILHKKTGSEILKRHFTQLLNALNRHQDVSISGPIACFRRGQEAFSRLLSFNTWLASACFAHKRRFIDNFNVFWNCADRFQADGLHPNRRGSRLLTANIRHALLITSNSENKLQTSSCKDTGPAQSLPPTLNSTVIELLTASHHELSVIDSHPEESFV